MHVLAQLSAPDVGFLALAIGLALSFEFVNGFHDTANAVATVIYTNSMRPWVAVGWSGLWNLIGVLVSGTGVAFTIVSLLPSDLVANIGSAIGFALIFSLLISAILWNLGTWYLGLPASSSHTLIGAILGVGLAHTMGIPGAHFGQGVNWSEASKALLALLISPAVGFVFAALLLLLSKFFLPDPVLYQPSPTGQPPPASIRAVLILTCTGVSAAHGSNDGQKGMGLMLLILIALWPAKYAVNLDTDPAKVIQLANTARLVQPAFDARGLTAADRPPDTAVVPTIAAFIRDEHAPDGHTFAALSILNHRIAAALDGKTHLAQLSVAQRRELRANMYLASEAISRLLKQNQITDPAQRTRLAAYAKSMDSTTLYIPFWVKLATALSLGLGTMIGWRRIVQTVGEKIGRQSLSYAQGASAGLVAMATIGLASGVHLPVSTTHVVSSGVAGTMVANRTGVQLRVLRNLAIAWILTLPVCVLLGAGFFSATLFFVINILHHP